MIYSRVSTISVKDEIIIITFIKSVTVNYTDILEIMKAIKSKFKNAKTLKLVDMSANNIEFTPEALNCLWSKSTKKNTIAMAVVLRNNYKNPDFNLEKRKIPIANFGDENSAIKWLQSKNHDVSMH